MRPELTLHTLRIERRSLLVWTVGFILTLVMYLAFYPSIADNAAAYKETLKSFPEALKRLSGAQGDVASPAGYMQGQFFATFGFILLLVFAIGRGTRAVAGEERAGMLELVLATPTTRTRLVLERSLALALELALIGLTIFVVVQVLGPSFDLDGISAGALAGACASAVLGAYVFGMIALAAGALRGESGFALAAGSALGALAFFYTTLSPLVSSLADHQAISPCWQAFGYAPLVSGLDWARLAVLVIEAAVLLGLAIWGFNRRDVG